MAPTNRFEPYTNRKPLSKLPTDEESSQTNSCTPLSLVDASRKLLREAKHYDVTIKSHGRTWKCHREILCQRCEFFNAALSGKFIENSTSTISMEDDDADGIDVLLEYIYTLEPPGTLGTNDAIQSMILGDKYRLEELSRAGSQALQDKIKHSFPRIRGSILAGDNNPSKVKFFRAVRWLWHIPKAVLEEVRGFIMQELAQLPESAFADDDLQELMGKDKAFRVELMQQMASRLPRASCTQDQDSKEDQSFANTSGQAVLNNAPYSMKTMACSSFYCQ